MHDDSGGDAELVLRCGVEVSEQIVDLERANRNQRQNFQIYSASERGGKTSLRGSGGGEHWPDGRCAGFMSSADQEMREGRNGPGKAKLRANQVGAQMRVRSLEGSGGIAEVSGKRERSQHFEGPADLETIQVERLCGERGGTSRNHASSLRRLREGDRGANEGITTEEFDTLRVRSRCQVEERENGHTDCSE